MYDQMELDTRNDYEQNIDVAIGEAQKSAHDYVIYLNGGVPVKNRHEGYGILAEKFVELQKSQKKVQAGMNEFLTILPTDTKHAVEESSSILNAAHEVATKATLMAAWAEKVMKDLYELQVTEEKTPLEGMMDGDDGFASADDVDEDDEPQEETDGSD